jgi:hypothetical protein
VFRRSGFVVLALSGSLLGFAAFAYRQSPAGDSAEAVTTTSPPAAAVTVPAPTTTAPTATVPTTTTTTLPPKGWLVIHGTGDVNTDVQYIPALASRGHDWAWSGLDGLLLEDDLTIINLECAPSRLGAKEPKAFNFRCDLDSLPVMLANGVEVANLANNHSQDYGKEAMVDGRNNLVAAGVAPVGAGADAAEAYAPAFFDLKGWRVAVLGFGGVVPHAGWLATDDRPGMASGDDTDAMVAAVAAAKAEADIVIVTVHWGMELKTEPLPDDVERAQAMIGAGADAIFGHHPHRLQAMETVAGRPVAWSLGNFVWPNLSVAGSTTAVARVVISPEGEVTGCLIPAFIESPGHPVLRGEPPCGVPE